MNTRRNFILLGIMATVIPSTCWLMALAPLSLSDGTALWHILLAALPGLVLIGGLIGYGTSIISAHQWLVVFGAQVGWFGGLVIANLFATPFPISPDGRLPLYAGYALWTCCGVLAGLAPALVARYINGVK